MIGDDEDPKDANDIDLEMPEDVVEGEAGEAPDDMPDGEGELENEDRPSFNTIVEPELASAVRAPIGRGFILSGFALSALLGGGLGGGIGVVGSKILAGSDKTVALRAEFSQELADIKSELNTARQSQTQKLAKKLDKNLGTTSSAQRKAQSRLKTLETQNKTLSDKIEALERNLTNLTAEITDNLITQGDAVNASGVESANPKTLGAQILGSQTSDEKTLSEAADGEEIVGTEISAQVPTNIGVEANSENAPKTAPKTASEIASENISEAASEISAPGPAIVATSTDTFETATDSPPKIDADNPWDALEVLTDTFPRAKMLAAVRAQEKISSEKPGWLKRTLSKHIKVRDEDITDPYATIATAEIALKEGRVSDALTQISKLNPPVRTSAAEWIQAAKKAVPIIEQDQ